MSLRDWCFFFGASLVSSSALAEQPSSALSYEAPADCPSRESFWHELSARSYRWAQGDRKAAGLSVTAQISKTGPEYVGKVLLGDASGPITEREVMGPTCADVTAALALVVAVTFDGLETESRRREPRPTAPVERRPIASMAFGPSLGAHTAVAPLLVPTVGLAATYTLPSHSGTTDLRIEGLVGLDSNEAVSTSGSTLGRARFLWLSTRSLACPFQLGDESTRLGPCLLFEVGALRGNGTTAIGDRSSTGWWVAPGMGLNARLRTDPLAFRLTGGFVLPLVRDTFVFEPEPTVFRPPAVGWLAELEVSWLFF